MNVTAANHDPAEFPVPDVFVIERDNAGKHLTFGRGPHVCIGKSLARNKMEEALRRLSSHFVDVELDGEPIDSAGADVVGGATTLPLRFKVRT